MCVCVCVCVLVCVCVERGIEEQVEKRSSLFLRRVVADCLAKTLRISSLCVLNYTDVRTIGRVEGEASVPRVTHEYPFVPTRTYLSTLLSVRVRRRRRRSNTFVCVLECV